MSKPLLKLINSKVDYTLDKELTKEELEIFKRKEIKLLEDCKNRKNSKVKYTELQKKLLGVHMGETMRRS